MKKFKFEDIEINLTEEVFDYPPTITETSIHEPDTYKYAIGILKIFTKNDIFIDVGACFGLFSLFLNKGTAFAFEPSSENFGILKRNVELNPEKNIKIFNEAVSNEVVNYYIKRQKQPGETRTIFGEGDRKTIILDDFLLPLLKSNQKVKLIKTDTESHDAAVLEGAKKIIQKYKPIIITESDVPRWIRDNSKNLGKFDNLNWIWQYV